ncbi:MAG: hypothetical protein RTU30_13760 [Candidatus Thorarchaeota archaeon]
MAEDYDQEHRLTLIQRSNEMDVTRIRHVLNALMILSFLVFGGLAGIIVITDAPLVAKTVALPFAFLFISLMTLITTGQIQSRPKGTRRYLGEWVTVCVFVNILCALALTFA